LRAGHISLQFTTLPYRCTYFKKASIHISQWVLTRRCPLPSPWWGEEGGRARCSSAPFM
jgi:hypothetical protein